MKLVYLYSPIQHLYVVDKGIRPTRTPISWAALVVSLRDPRAPVRPALITKSVRRVNLSITVQKILLSCASNLYNNSCQWICRWVK